MTNDDAEQGARVEHRIPTPATIKQLYGTAFRCGEPSCLRPLYRLNNDTGEWILNSRVAHIHARSEGGPRWNPEMTEEENRGVGNLLPLCEEYAFEIDATPEHFPADLLRGWKQAQLDEYVDLQKSWSLSDAEAAEVTAASFDPHRAGAAAVAATTVLTVARYAGLLIETGRQQRRIPLAAASAWQAMRERVQRSMFGFDSDGERVLVEPSFAETQPHQVALEAALTEAVTSMEPIAAQLIAELHAVGAVDPRLTRWCDWVEAATRGVLTAAGRWPGRPPSDDDEVWPDAIADLQRASQALAATWRGETAAEPPEPRPLAPEPTESDEQRAAREHHELLEAARPWARVTGRPYNAELCQRLMDATSTVANLPDLPSLLTVGLDATARLAAKVARNADDASFRALIVRAARQQPLIAAVALLRELMFTAKASARGELETEAEAEATRLLQAESWQDSAVWTETACTRESCSAGQRPSPATAR